MAKQLRVLVGCEESQEVTKAFRLLGHEAYSCDLQDCSGGFPEWHFQGDVFEALRLVEPDLVILHPPCTRLATCGNKYYKPEFLHHNPQIFEQRKDAIGFFMKCVSLDIPFCVENPVGIMSTHYRKPDQIIQPFQFGHPHQKSTCLWLNRLPLLHPTLLVEPEFVVDSKGNRYSKWSYDTFRVPRKDRAKARSKTFPGIATAMAEQYSSYLIQK